MNMEINKRCPEEPRETEPSHFGGDKVSRMSPIGRLGGIGALVLEGIVIHWDVRPVRGRMMGERGQQLSMSCPLSE